MGGRSPLSSCGHRSVLPPPVVGFANRSFYNINIGDLPMPVFQQAPMLPIFYVRRPNPTFDVANRHTHSAGSPVVNAVTRLLKSTA